MRSPFYVIALMALLTLVAGCGKSGTDAALTPDTATAATAGAAASAPLEPAAGATVAMQPGADTEPPIIAGLEDRMVPVRPGARGTTVRLVEPTVTDNLDPHPTLTNNAPSTFPMGQTTVTWTATDASGNTSTAEQVVTVTSQYPPPGGQAH